MADCAESSLLNALPYEQAGVLSSDKGEKEEARGKRGQAAKGACCVLLDKTQTSSKCNFFFQGNMRESPEWRTS